MTSLISAIIYTNNNRVDDYKNIKEFYNRLDKNSYLIISLDFFNANKDLLLGTRNIIVDKHTVYDFLKSMKNSEFKTYVIGLDTVNLLDDIIDRFYIINTKSDNEVGELFELPDYYHLYDNQTTYNEDLKTIITTDVYMIEEERKQYI